MFVTTTPTVTRPDCRSDMLYKITVGRANPINPEKIQCINHSMKQRTNDINDRINCGGKRMVVIFGVAK